MPPFDPLVFLRSLGPFGSWSQDANLAAALTELADRAEVWTFAAGDLVRFPDEGPLGQTWVAEGCLVVLEAESPRYVGVREPVNAPAGVWIRGQTEGRLVIVHDLSWNAWLRAWPRAAQTLDLTPPPPLPRSLVRSPLVLEPGETPVHLFRKSAWFLALRALVPAGFFVFFLAFGLLLQFGLAPPVHPAALWFLPGLGLVVTLALMVLVSWEWHTSVLAVTDRSVIIRQVDVWTHRSDFDKLALDRIREASMIRQGWIDRLFGLVNLEIEGDSPQGRLVFPGLPRDSRFVEAVEALRQRRAAAPPGRQAIRRALADRAGGARAPRLERPAVKQEVLAPRARRLSWRTERDGGVWFRRHPWLLLKRTLPWFGWTLLIAFLGWVAYGFWPSGLGVVAIVAALAFLVPLGGIIWEFWDWADDRLSIQGDTIILVHKRPLWLGEVRQQGNLDQVRQVGIRKTQLAALILDFGTVTIDLGSSDPLVFEAASHPDWVQSEIFYRRSLLTQDRERREAETRLQEVTEILDTWEEARNAGYFHDGKEQA